MELLEFARGPGLEIAVVIFIAGPVGARIPSVEIADFDRIGNAVWPGVQPLSGTGVSFFVVQPVIIIVQAVVSNTGTFQKGKAGNANRRPAAG